jgi:hypothetical protein
VKVGWKIAGCVALIGLLAADIGLQATTYFGTPTGGPGWRTRVPENGQINANQTASWQNRPDQPKITDWLILIVIFAQAVIYAHQSGIMKETFRWGHRPRVRVKHVWAKLHFTNLLARGR